MLTLKICMRFLERVKDKSRVVTETRRVPPLGETTFLSLIGNNLLFFYVDFNFAFGCFSFSIQVKIILLFGYYIFIII